MLQGLSFAELKTPCKHQYGCRIDTPHRCERKLLPSTKKRCATVKFMKCEWSASCLSHCVYANMCAKEKKEVEEMGTNMEIRFCVKALTETIDAPGDLFNIYTKLSVAGYVGRTGGRSTWSLFCDSDRPQLWTFAPINGGNKTLFSSLVLMSP